MVTYERPKGPVLLDQKGQGDDIRSVNKTLFS